MRRHPHQVSSQLHKLHTSLRYVMGGASGVAIMRHGMTSGCLYCLLGQVAACMMQQADPDEALLLVTALQKPAK